MLTPTLLLTAVALAMDAVAVSIASGLSERKRHFGNALKMAFIFGLFQGLMPLGGFFLGLYIADWVSAWGAWIVFIVLVVLGINMIREARTTGDETLHSPFRTSKIITLAIATSIDAFAVGVGFSLIDSGLIITCVTIGIVTFLLCLPAVWFGAKLGTRFAKRAEMFGGVVLMAIGCKILIAHLLKGL